MTPTVRALSEIGSELKTCWYTRLADDSGELREDLFRGVTLESVREVREHNLFAVAAS